MDPVYKNSPYETFGSNPILLVDLLGLDTTKSSKAAKVGDVLQHQKGNSNFFWNKVASGNGLDSYEPGGSSGDLQLVTVRSVRKKSLADRTGALKWANFDKAAFKKWDSGLSDYSSMRNQGISAESASKYYADQGKMYERYYQAEQDYRNMQFAVVVIFAAPAVAVTAPEVFVASMSTRLISVGADASVQYVSNAPYHGFGMNNFEHMNLTSLAGSFAAPGGACMSSLIGNGFAYSRADGYNGFTANSNNVNVMSNVAIGFVGNRIGNHYNSLLKNPKTPASIFRGNLMGNSHGNGLQSIKDFYLHLNP